MRISDWSSDVCSSDLDHVAHLTVHGVLHLLGYDHMTADEAAAMEPREVQVLAGLGIADPYVRPAAKKKPVSKKKPASKKPASKKSESKRPVSKKPVSKKIGRAHV